MTYDFFELDDPHAFWRNLALRAKKGAVFMSPETKEILGQAISILATLVTIVSYQFNHKGKLLIAQTLSTALLSASYFFLGATSGFALNIVGIVRNFCFYFQPKTGRVPYFTGAFFSLAMGVVGALSWQGPVSLLIIVALMVNAVCMSVLSPQGLRISILFTCAAILTYNIFVFNIGAILNEGFSIVSSAVGILRYRQKSTEK